MRQIPFSPPDITEAEIEAVTQALRSGWITTGPQTKRLEQRIRDYTGAAGAACLNSATAALELTLRLLGVGPGDEVITSAYTYTASASVAAHVGAKIVFADVAPGSLEMDYDKLDGYINERTKAVIPVDVGGCMCDYDRIFGAVRRASGRFRPANDLQALYGRPVVLSDAAHSFGARRRGLRSGEAADFTCFSFHAVKNLTTAEGGAVVWRAAPGLDSDYVYRELMLLSLHGQNKDALSKTKLGQWEYDIVYPAYKCNMPDTLAALGNAQLDRYGGILARRREMIERYDAALAPLGLWTLSHYGTDFASSGHLYILRVPGFRVEQRNEAIVRLAEQGVAANVHYKPLPMMTAYKRMGFDIADYPNAYAMYENEITLPLHGRLTDEDIDYVAGACTQAFGAVKRG